MKTKKQSSKRSVSIKFFGFIVCLISCISMNGQIIVQSQGYGTDESEPFPTSFTSISGSDLATSATISDVETGGRGDSTSRLFDGIAGAGSGFEAQFNTGSITINLNTSLHKYGYDITNINTYAAWNTAGGGRSDQEYTLTVIYMDDTTEEIISGTHYDNTTTASDENGEVNVWTEVTISDQTGVIAEGVKAVRFDFLTSANAGGTATYTEFDIIGYPISETDDGFTFNHPGIGFTTDDLDAIKANLTIEPWKTAYEELLASSQSSLSYQMQGPFAGVGRSENNGAYTSDMKAVHNMARLWYFTGNETYAQKARDILIAWANGHTEWLPGETYLTMGYEAFRIFEGADLLRGAWSGWTQSDTDIMKNYVRNVWLDPLHLNVPGPMRSANQGMAQFAAAINIAVFLDDKDLFDELLYIFRTDASSGLLSSLPNGQVGDSGRDAHDQGQIMLWARSAETFWQQGIDVYSEYDNRILAATEYLSRANLLVETPFIQAGTVYDVYPEYHYFDSPFGGSYQIETSMLNLVYSAYVTRMGMSAPYLEKYITFATGEEASFTYLVPSDNSTANPPPTIGGPATVASVTSLSNSDIGDATGGSTSYNNGTWTLNGTGSSFWNNSEPDYHFAYLPVEGDATIIAKLTSLSGGSAENARAGLVFTENLTDDAAMGSVFITNPDVLAEMYAFSRGDVAHSHNSNSSTRQFPRFSDNDDGLAPYPYWFKIERIGKRVTWYSSPDGVSWSASNVADFDLGTTAYFGLAVSSMDSNSAATATFTDVRITGGDGGEVSEAPETPFAIYASRGANQISLRWLESFEATSYKIWRSTTSGGSYSLLTEQTGTSFIDTTTNPCDKYYYAVSAVNSVGESALSPEDEFHFVNTNWYEAEDYDAQSGIQTEGTRDHFGGRNIGWIHNGDWTRYNDIKIISENPIFRVRAAAYNDTTGDIEIRIGSPSGTLIGTVTPMYTGRTQYWATNETTLNVQPGVYDIYLVFKDEVGFNINWFDIVPTDVALQVFPDVAFEGESVEFVAGHYSAANNDFEDNEISSLQITEGFEVEVFQSDDFTGNSLVLQAGDVICLKDASFEDSISSLIVRQSSLSVDSIEENKFSLYPNPAKDQISFSSPIHSIKIVDISGKVVKMFEEETESLNVSDLAAGFYILKAQSSDNVAITRKLIKE